MIETTPIKRTRKRKVILNRVLNFTVNPLSHVLFPEGKKGKLKNKKGRSISYKILHCSTEGVGRLKAPRKNFRKVTYKKASLIF